MTSKQTVAVVTGAARGIGEASALRLAEDGIAVVCVDIDASVSQTAATIREHGGQALHVAVNLSRPDAHELVTQAAVDTFGGIDVYHANAGIQTIAPLEATTHADWDSLLGTNLKAVAFGIAAALPIMRERGGGSIIITASILGVVGDPNMPAYGATKGALRAFCRALASRHGVDNIRVNTVCPGDVEASWDSWRLLFLEKMEPWQTTNNPRNAGTRRSFGNGPSGWCSKPTSRAVSASA